MKKILSYIILFPKTWIVLFVMNMPLFILIATTENSQDEVLKLIHSKSSINEAKCIVYSLLGETDFFPNYFLMLVWFILAPFSFYEIGWFKVKR